MNPDYINPPPNRIPTEGMPATLTIPNRGTRAVFYYGISRNGYARVSRYRHKVGSAIYSVSPEFVTLDPAQS